MGNLGGSSERLSRRSRVCGVCMRESAGFSVSLLTQSPILGHLERRFPVAQRMIFSHIEINRHCQVSSHGGALHPFDKLRGDRSGLISLTKTISVPHFGQYITRASAAVELPESVLCGSDTKLNSSLTALSRSRFLELRKP